MYIKYYELTNHGDLWELKGVRAQNIISRTTAKVFTVSILNDVSLQLQFKS